MTAPKRGTKGKQRARVRATSESRAGNGPTKAQLEDELLDAEGANYSLSEEVAERGRLLTEAKAELAAKEASLNSALAQAEAQKQEMREEFDVSKKLMLKYLGTLHEVGHALDLLVGSDVTNDLVAHAKRIAAEKANLEADVLKQVDTLAALRREIVGLKAERDRLAQKVSNRDLQVTNYMAENADLAASRKRWRFGYWAQWAVWVIIVIWAALR